MARRRFGLHDRPQPMADIPWHSLVSMSFTETQWALLNGAGMGIFLALVCPVLMVADVVERLVAWVNEQ